MPAPPATTHVGLNEPSHSHTGRLELLWQTGSSWSVKWAAVAHCGRAMCGTGGAGGHTGWSSAVGLSWASSLRAGRAGLWFTAVLNGPWESNVMDSVGLHTLALCIRVFLDSRSVSIFSLAQCCTCTHTFFFSHKRLFFLPPSWSRWGKCSLGCKAWHCHYRQSLTCLWFSLTLCFSFYLSSSLIHVLLQLVGESWCGWRSNPEY